MPSMQCTQELAEIPRGLTNIVRIVADILRKNEAMAADAAMAKKESLATPKGFEPSISTVTGWHVRPLHHGAGHTQNYNSLDAPVSTAANGGMGAGGWGTGP